MEIDYLSLYLKKFAELSKLTPNFIENEEEIILICDELDEIWWEHLDEEQMEFVRRLDLENC